MLDLNKNQQLLHIFTDIQKHRTGSQYHFSCGLKHTLGLFFTTAIMTIIVQINVFHNVKRKVWSCCLRVDNVLFQFFPSSSHLVQILDIYKQIQRLLYKNGTELTQSQANILIMGKKYAQIIESVWFTHLYYSIIPGGAILILIGFACYYWVDKFTLLRRPSLNQNVNGDLCVWAMKLIDASLLMRAIGEFIFDYQIRDHTTFQSIICICIGAVYFVLPMDTILQFFHNQRYRVEQKSYAQVKSKFVQNYHTMHPLYTQEKYALIDRLKILGQSKNFIVAYSSSKNVDKSMQELIEVSPSKNSFE